MTIYSLLQRNGNAEDHLPTDYRRRAPVLYVPGVRKSHAVSVQATVHVHVQPWSRWLQESRFHSRGLYSRIEAVDPVPGVSRCWRIGECSWVFIIQFDIMTFYSNTITMSIIEASYNGQLLNKNCSNNKYYRYKI